MKLTKEDYMRLPKERLAELLVELNQPIIKIDPGIPEVPQIQRWKGWCDGTVCTNPQMDCINCPRTLHYGINISTADSSKTEAE